MITIVYKINVSDSDRELISSLQNDYSISFRKMYNNIELMKDNNFINSLKIKSKKQIEYLQKEVESFYKKNEANKNKIKTNITKLESLDELNLKKFKHLNYLKKSLNKKIIFGDKTELIKLSKGNGDINKWKESRLLPLVFYGDASRYGNRFFDIKNISKGEILFKLEGTKIKIPIRFNNKKHLNKLIGIQTLIKDKCIPITIKLSKDLLYITYDESILNNTNIDIKSFYKEITHIKDKLKRKELIANKYREHEIYLKKGKLDRYLGIDLNPDGIGYSIIDNNMRLIKSGYLDISKIYDSNKRKYETTILIKELFKLIKHYKCSYIVTEELNLNNTDLGNKISNRKVNNLWNRDLIKEIINRRCNETGTILIEINPVYTSFIGNILHNTFDPIASSMEICRRGIYKYSKGGFYPEIDIANFINDERYGKIKECLTWKDMYSLFVTSKWSYRRRLNDFSFIGFNLGNKKSMCKHIYIQ
jgi:IS605 OrfB family transposase